MQDLREQLEAHVVTIETLRTEIKVAQAQHGKVYITFMKCLYFALFFKCYVSPSVNNFALALHGPL
jgi:hypothetical protein